MYESIRGTLQEKDPLKAVVETSGLAYRVLIPLSTYMRLPNLEASVKLYLSHVVREDSQNLYGFDQKEERNLFETLLNISGIGPKTALAIVGHMDIGAFERAIASADIRILSKLPGIGKKTAERLVIEMRDKFKTPKSAGPAPIANLQNDAIAALIHLGYSPAQAQKAVSSVSDKETDLGRLITAALQHM